MPAEATTAAPADALTRLRNRPRLRVEKPAAKAAAPGPAAPGKRPLPNGLVPRRPRPGQATTHEPTASVEGGASEGGDEPAEQHEGDELSEASDVVPTAASTSEAPVASATPESRLASLIGNRRRAGARRPGTLGNRPASDE
ncbi:hypothetical protein LSTR_LSTR012243 [Laodelphax striatellus]|uniref:Uncharacterized protein n=1 Tax=Laodelphax striatellus TaxID=195883 RepID=A0A482X7J9_LAOST|nr:hypothetical protein LSTR_LSTR012243 [Laodelphax striatellus]